MMNVRPRGRSWACSGLPGLSHRPSSGAKAASALHEDDGCRAQDAGFQSQEDPDTKLKSHGVGRGSPAHPQSTEATIHSQKVETAHVSPDR